MEILMEVLKLYAFNCHYKYRHDCFIDPYEFYASFFFDTSRRGSALFNATNDEYIYDRSRSVTVRSIVKNFNCAKVRRVIAARLS